MTPCSTSLIQVYTSIQHKAILNFLTVPLKLSKTWVCMLLFKRPFYQILFALSKVHQQA
jgi:hypothetical protein